MLGTITLGSGSSGTDRRVSCRQYPKKVLERFSLRSLLRSSPSAVRGAGFGVGGASVLQRDGLVSGQCRGVGAGLCCSPAGPQPGTAALSQAPALTLAELSSGCLRWDQEGEARMAQGQRCPGELGGLHVACLLCVLPMGWGWHGGMGP